MVEVVEDLPAVEVEEVALVVVVVEEVTVVGMAEDLVLPEVAATEVVALGEDAVAEDTRRTEGIRTRNSKIIREYGSITIDRYIQITVLP